MADEDLDMKNLEKIMRALRKGALQNIKIGIFGSKTFRGDGTTNAQIGSYHEFGTSSLPVRSFLRMPITEHLGKYLEGSGAFGDGDVKEILKQGDIKPWLNKVAVVAETVVMDAFDSSGFGKWPPSDMTNKDNHQTLIETQQLRNSITTEVK